VTNTYKGKCFCGAVEFEATGTPAIMGYCHCADCAAWSAGPINSFTLWQPDSVRITKGASKVGTYNKTENSFRKFCTECGGHLMTDHPGMKLVDVYAVLLEDFDYKPTLHVNYESKTVSVPDGLPKFRDMPTEVGGSGETMAD
jgi:hypothetical protein